MNPPFILRSGWRGYKQTRWKTDFGYRDVRQNIVERIARGAVAPRCCWRSLGAGASQAGDGHDHDRARQALEAGEIAAACGRSWNGSSATIRGRSWKSNWSAKDARWIYEIKLLRTGGSLVKLEVDARDGSIIAHQGAEGARTDHRGAAR